MHLKNKENGKLYLVRTEDDRHGGFMIFATEVANKLPFDSFCMHYRTLAEFCRDWDDID